ncbi:MAG: hypothetical protein JOY66_24455 [Acetobacteraceae bacterium]|nr:hypothetical protein [Acetobacteraceae bacterium]
MYELRINGQRVAAYPDEAMALSRVRQATWLNPDAEIELTDAQTGRPSEVTASVSGRRNEIAARMRRRAETARRPAGLGESLIRL